ncbi:hypothetical protein CBM2634_U320004 [Cupriavidus taiwanensis]|uniref:Uncharacterized protein n=1 Tax=Cupriavidus taiwanensis TaxID=164546 RepID=A0A375JFK8_9BURK|nr:hypothetical protein CBM2634_U320004 [Cupriavidus taiwanensis]
MAGPPERVAFGQTGVVNGAN